ncbi:Gfo/Idh/MocA family protein [Maribacter sp. 2-571]|uniref:Gfo/Idh/MocA family protein n=1 Tax=Maribacter sp. 2-571 TaxID=3417569 RepID=UPI003D35512A
MDKTNFHIDRRHFIKGATAAMALSSLGAYGMDLTPNGRALKVGLIGTGWYGKSDLFRLMQVANVSVLGLCDVDARQLSAAAKLVAQRQPKHTPPKQYTDYRKMLAEQRLDIVLIGTPDHWHAMQAIDAIKSGAHIYLQKPISVDVLEGEALMAVAKKYGKTVQVGMQRRSTPHLIEAKQKIVDTGMLGNIAHVEMWCYYHMRDTKNRPTAPVPDYFDYDMWTGPAPLRSFDGIPHRRWRSFMEYGNGIVGDMCIHMLDAVRWMLGLGWPKRISSTGGIYVQKDAKANTTDTQNAIFEFDELDCVWQHRSWGTPDDPEYPWAFKIYGDKGTLTGSVFKYEFVPVKKGKILTGKVRYEREEYPEDLSEADIELHTAPATRNHMLDFLSAIDQNSDPVADLREGHISTASCILANMALALKRPLSYDAINKVIVNDPEATKLLQRAYREGWQHPSKELF